MEELLGLVVPRLLPNRFHFQSPLHLYLYPLNLRHDGPAMEFVILQVKSFRVIAAGGDRRPPIHRKIQNGRGHDEQQA